MSTFEEQLDSIVDQAEGRLREIGVGMTPRELTCWRAGFRSALMFCQKAHDDILEENGLERELRPLL